MATTNQLGIPIAVGNVGESLVKRDADGDFSANEITGNLFNVQHGSLSQTAISYDFSFIDADLTDYVKYGGVAVTNSNTTLGAENGLMQFQAVRNGGIVNWQAYQAATNTIYLGFTGTTYNLPGFATNTLLATNIDQNIVAASGTYGISISGNAATATLASTVTTNANLTGPVTSVGNTTSITNGAITNTMLAGGITASKLVQTDIVIAESQVTNLTTDLAAKLNLAGGTMLGALTLNANAMTALQPVTLQQMNAALVGLWDDRGNYDASVNAYPSSGGSGTAGAILKGDIWTISVAGTLPTAQSVEPGDTVRALIDTPGNTQANWAIAQNNVGYTPLSNVLASTQVFVGNGSNVAAGVALTGAIAITNTGVTSINNLYVTNAMIANTTIDLTAKVTGILPGANGGTGNGFFAVSGPATSLKTFTFPNASATVLTTNAAVTAAQGGTGLDSSAWAQGDLPYISATGVWNHLAKNTTATRYLANTGASNNPAWSQIDLTNGVSGILPNSNTTAATTNIASTIVARDGSGNFSAGTITATSFSGPATSAANLIGGALGSLPYQSGSSTTSLLSGNTSTTPQILTQVGNGSVSAAPTWTSSPTLTGLSITSTGAVFATITSTTTGSANEGGLNLVRGDQANGYAQVHYKTGASDKWATGLRLGNDTYQIYDVTNSLAKYTAVAGTTGTGSHSFDGSVAISANGSTTNAGQMLGINGANVSSGSMYGIGIQKSGTDLLYLGINKNTTTGAVPANAVYISTFGTASKLSIGRGDGTGSLSTSDILLNGDGSVSLGSSATLNVATNAALTGVNAGLTISGTLGDGNYINFGTGGRNIGVFNGGVFFHTFNADYNATNNDYKYNSTAAATAIELGFSSVKLRAAASGTAGNAITFQDVLTATVSGIAVTGDSNGVAIDATATASGILNQITVANPSNTANSGSLFKASTAGASSGDALYQVVNVGTGQTYSWGLDNSVANDPFVFSCSGSLGTTNAYSIDSSANMTVNNNFASVGGYPSYQCRAWLNFNGTGVVAIRGSGNVSSVTDSGTGAYIANLTNSMPDANYSVALSVQDTTNRAAVINGGNTSASVLTTSAVPIATVGASASNTDMSVICMQVFR